MNVHSAINLRRSYRSLDQIEITEELIQDLAKSAQLAPSCLNNQPWNFIFVKSKDQLTKLFTTLTQGNKWVEKASMLIGVFSKESYDCVIGERLYYLFDTGIATAFILLRAIELGLVAHSIAGFNENKAKKILEIPEEMRLITLIVIGKHSEKINPILSEPMKLGERQRPPRKNLSEFIYIDSYNSRIN